MTAKAVKIADIKGPDKVAPAASSRPLVVTNRPVIADPMVVTSKEEAKVEEPKTPTRTTKVIKPMTLTAADLEPEKSEKESDETEAPEVVDTPDSGSTSLPLEQPAESEVSTAKTTLSTEPARTESSESTERDTDAEAEHAKEQAAEAARARQQELDALIASGKYAVPVGAVRRRKSRMVVILLCIVGLLLAAVLADVLFDMGTLSAPKNIPHTHFFSS